jgi:hypothetical protein
MTRVPFQRAFATIKARVPPWIPRPIRNATTAALTPVLFSYNSGHFRSCLKRLAVSKHGEPIPWYSYPCIEFLRHRPFHDKTILEFGGGQSTLWWAKRARKVVTFEGDKRWLEKLARKVESNVELHHVAQDDRTACVAEVEAVLQRRPGFLYDVAIIDGLWRFEMIEIAVRALADEGMIICDDADGYGFHRGFMGRDLNRVDFYGHVPGGAFPHVTSIYFPGKSFCFNSSHPIPIAAFQ